jgi:ABC-type nitrate/sulfonate/bicarbonate transport system ATPase subunit
MTTSLIEVDRASKRYESRRSTVKALSDVSMTVQEGEFVALLGRSGSGKTTLLRLLAGLDRPSSGAITIDGANVQRPPRGVRYVFQDYATSLLPWKTVTQNVEFGIRHASHHQVNGSTAADFLATVGLGKVGDRYPWQLSGGMQQRLAIARAVASRPKVLLMDEPFSAVDALSRARLQDATLRVWAEFGLTIVFVTHDIDEAIYLADRVLVLSANGQGLAEQVTVRLVRPRDQVATREDPSFLGLRRHLYSIVAGSGDTDDDDR